MNKTIKSIFNNCNSILILIILVSILILALIWYKKQKYEHFQNNETIFILKNIQNPNEKILRYMTNSYTIPGIQHKVEIDMDKIRVHDNIYRDANFIKLSNQVLANCLLNSNCKGIETYFINEEVNNVKKQYAYVYPLKGPIVEYNLDKDRDIVMKINKEKGAFLRQVEFVNNKANMFEDKTGTYQFYINKVPSNKLKYRILGEGSVPLLMAISDTEFPKNIIKLISDDICKDNNNNCETFGLTIMKDGSIRVLLDTDKVDPAKLEDLPDDIKFSIIYSKNKLDIPTNTPSQSSKSELSGKCANLSLTSKDIGKDCFGQLWAENKCDNPIPEYNDTFKALSYQEIATEMKDSKCYTDTNWKRQVTSSKKLKDTKTKQVNMTLYDKAKYILKTMLVPDADVPEYNKEETEKVTIKNDTKNMKENKTVGISVYELQAN
jgi:hypothetical protein